jgi:uncharacterized protein YdeI (YjbR/CyaY-like superfamily)
MPAVNIDPKDALQFDTEARFDAWLAAHHATQRAVWVLLHKVGSERASMTGKQGIDVALCLGWIDAVRNKLDDTSYLQRYAPRRKSAIWSQLNIANVERLMRAGRMHAAGQREVDAARVDGRWAKAYGGGRAMPPRPDLQSAIDAVPAAQVALTRLDAKNRFALAFRVHVLKTESGRRRKIAAFVDMLARGEVLIRPPPDKEIRHV